MTNNDDRTTSMEGDRVATNETVTASNDAAPGLPITLTVDEVAALLRLDRKTVYNAIARKEIPGVLRLGRSIRLSRDAVLGWLRDGQGRAPRSGRSR